jgi:hypothetical protein
MAITSRTNGRLREVVPLIPRISTTQAERLNGVAFRKGAASSPCAKSDSAPLANPERSESGGHAGRLLLLRVIGQLKQQPC